MTPAAAGRSPTGLESVKKNDQVADVGMVSRYPARLFSNNRTTAKRRGFNLTL
jgi:hypothetical protein